LRPPVLYLAHRVPFPPDKGDRIRNYHLLRQLAGRFRVSLGCLADEPVEPATLAELRRLCERVAVVPVPRLRMLRAAAWAALSGGSLSQGAHLSTDLTRQVDDWQRAEPFAAAVASASSLTPYLLRASLRGVPRFVDVVDVDSQKWADFAAAARPPRRWLYRFEAERVRADERRLAGWARGVTLVSRAEADLFDRAAGPGTAAVATNGVDLDYFRPTPADERPACVFVGALDYLPNVDAAVWFADAVWPRVRDRRPDAEFWLVGRKPAPAVRRLAALPGVTLVGQVPDVRPHVAAAAVAVVPMRLSRGLQNKVLEALAMGKATVAAPPALAALAAQPGRDLLAASTADEWAEAVVGLLGDPARRAELGAAGRRFVEEHHHWDRCLAPLTDAIERAAGEREPVAEVARR
jgi:sugar transferase (PEP-CTERM/EpsH1 system associated)